MKINHHQFSMNPPEKERLWEEQRRHFKDYCVNRYQWFKYPEWHYVAPFPLHVDFEASFRCNLKCPMCFRPHIDRKDYGDMAFELYQKGIDECAEHGLYSIRLSWRGESTLHPRLVEMVAYAKLKGIKEVSFITNGTLLNESLSNELIQAGLDYITISVDGLPRHYNRLRAPSTYDGVTERIRRLYELKTRTGAGYPLVKVQAIWTYVKEDPETFYRHFCPITDNISFDPENDYSLRDVPQDDAFVCQYPWQRITITWNGGIPLCISDWNASTLIGDLRRQTIREVWLGAEMNHYREQQRNRKRLSIACCRQCHRPSTEQLGNKPEGKNGDSLSRSKSSQ
jgi:hypothetical protein